MGCDELQGYLFSPPLAVHDLVDWTVSWASREELRGVGVSPDLPTGA